MVPVDHRLLAIVGAAAAALSETKSGKLLDSFKMEALQDAIILSLMASLRATDRRLLLLRPPRGDPPLEGTLKDEVGSVEHRVILAKGRRFPNLGASSGGKSLSILMEEGILKVLEVPAVDKPFMRLKLPMAMALLIVKEAFLLLEPEGAVPEASFRVFMAILVSFKRFQPAHLAAPFAAATVLWTSTVPLRLLPVRSDREMRSLWLRQRRLGAEPRDLRRFPPLPLPLRRE